MNDHADIVREALLSARGERRVDERILDRAFAALSRVETELAETKRNEQGAIDALQSLAADHYFDALSAVKARADAAEAERDRLREALREIAGWNNWNGQDVQDIARAALAAKEGFNPNICPSAWTHIPDKEGT